MHAHWQQWLDRPGIELEGDVVVTTPTAESKTRSVALTDYSIISVNGPDAHKFLQGQLSCDLAKVDTDDNLPGAHCNIKGHIHSLFQVIKAGDDSYWLRTRSELAESSLALLKKYIIFSRAEAVLQPDLLGIGLVGRDSVALMQVTLPEGAVTVAHNDQLGEIWLPAEQLAPTLERLQEQAPLDSRNSWELAAVNAAIPELFPATREAFIPQMVNLQVFEGVSFNKGCYTGQEIVTRLQHRGQLKRPMYLAAVAAEQAPQPGGNLASQDKASVGQIVRVAEEQPGRYRLLAVLIKAEAEAGQIHLDNADGPTLELLPLPYTLDPSLFVSKR